MAPTRHHGTHECGGDGDDDHGRARARRCPIATAGRARTRRHINRRLNGRVGSPRSNHARCGVADRDLFRGVVFGRGLHSTPGSTSHRGDRGNAPTPPAAVDRRGCHRPRHAGRTCRRRRQRRPSARRPIAFGGWHAPAALLRIGRRAAAKVVSGRCTSWAPTTTASPDCRGHRRFQRSCNCVGLGCRRGGTPRGRAGRHPRLATIWPIPTRHRSRSWRGAANSRPSSRSLRVKDG